MIRARRRIRWNRAFREIGFIVVGVLIALTGNSWWQHRQDRTSERTYLRQLLADTRANEALLAAAISEDSVTQWHNAEQLRALQRASAPPDSVLEHWMSSPNGMYSDPRPRLGTLTALLQTGDVRLLRDDSLRSRLIGYASEMDYDLAELGRTVDLVLAGERLLHSRYAADGLALRFTTAEVGFRADEQQAFISSYRARWSTLQHDPEVRSGLQQILVGHNIRLFYLSRMLQSTRGLRLLLEARSDD